MSAKKRYKSSYYNIDESRQFRFIRTPYDLIHDEKFKNLSIHAKFLYGLLLDRMGFSRERNWYDDKGRAYIIYKVEEAMNDLCCGNKACTGYFKELEDHALIERVKRGNGLAAIIYVKNFSTVEESDEDQMPSGLNNGDIVDDSQWSKIWTNGHVESTCPMVLKSDHEEKDQKSDIRHVESTCLDMSKGHVHNIDIYQTVNYQTNSYSHSFNNKLDLKDSSRPEIAELNERMKSRMDNTLLGDRLGLAKDDYHLSDEDFKRIYEELYYDDKTVASDDKELIELFAKDLIQYDDFDEWDKKTYAKAILDLIVEIFVSKNSFIKIGKDCEVTRNEFVRKILILDHATIYELLKDLKKRIDFEAVRYPKNYILKSLFDANLNQGSAIQLKYSDLY